MKDLYWRIRNFIMYRIFGLKRTLSADYTIDPDVEFEAMHSQELEDALTEALIQEILNMDDEELAETVALLETKIAKLNAGDDI